MRHTAVKTTILALLMALYALPAAAVKAVPHPVTVTQPDGTTLTIQIFGDEFLHWTTVGDRLVEKGPDGFYYYAEFNSDGTKTLSRTRAKASSISRSGVSSVTPPPAAIAAAKMRRQAVEIMRGENGLGWGDNHFLVLLIQFPDLEFEVENAHEAFYNMLNEPGYSQNGGTGSAADYYAENSSGQFTPTFDLYGPITVSNSYAYYGRNDDPNEKADYLLVEACQLADDEIDFSQYDLDGDGVVDNIFFFYAGHNEAEGGGSDCIWPHKWNIVRPQYSPLDGKRLDSYACTSEFSGSYGQNMAGIGTFCHEFGHVIGFPDFYDVDYEQNGYAAGLGGMSLMDAGSYNNSGRTPPYLSAFERYYMGWVEELTVWEEPGVMTLEPVQNNAGYVIPTDNEGEVFVLEYRNGEGSDQYLYAEGIVLYHVDQSNNIISGLSARSLWRYYNMVNSFADHQCYDLIESSTSESTALNNMDRVFPGRRNVTEINAYTTPAMVGWDGQSTGYSISGITLADDHAELSLGILKSGPSFGDFSENGINAIYVKQNYSAGETLEFLLSLSSNLPSVIEWYFDGERQSAESIELTSGEHTIQAVLTYDDGSKEELSTKISVK